MVFKPGKLSVPRGLVERSSTPKGCLTLFVCSLSLTTGLWVKTRNKAHLCSRIEQNYYTQHVICGPLSVMVSSGSSWRWKILSTRSWAISKAEQQNVQPQKNDNENDGVNSWQVTRSTALWDHGCPEVRRRWSRPEENQNKMLYCISKKSCSQNLFLQTRFLCQNLEINEIPATLCLPCHMVRSLSCCVGTLPFINNWFQFA